MGGQHHQNEHDGVYQHPIVGELTQGLGQDREGGGRDDRAAHAAQSPQHDKHQDENGGVEVKLGGYKGGLAAPVERARGPCQGGGDHEGDHLILGDADAHALGRNAVVPGGHDGPAGAAVDQIKDNCQRHQHQHKPGRKGGDPLGVHHPHGPPDELHAPFAQLVGVAQEAELEAVFVHPQVDVGDDALDDLTESQGDNGQVVAVEPEHRDADEEAQQGGHRRPRRHGQRQAQGGEGHAVLEGQGHGGAGESADAHKARVAQAQLAGHAHHQVQGQGHDYVRADGDQLALQHGANAPLLEGAHKLHDQKGGDHQDICKEAAAGGALHLSKSFHLLHLTLSPGRPCPEGRRASPAAPQSARRRRWRWRAGWICRLRQKSR